MSEKDITAVRKSPIWYDNLRATDCVVMDVRPILSQGVDPLTQILEKVDQLSPGDILLIETPFDPLPLRRLMGSRGYDSHVVPVAEGHWQTYFKWQEERRLPELPDLPKFPMMWQEGVLEMDLRSLEPPNPMIAVLKIIENGAGGDAFMVRLIRNPIYLYPELAERQWQAEVIETDKDGLRVRIFNQNPKGIR